MEQKRRTVISRNRTYFVCYMKIGQSFTGFCLPFLVAIVKVPLVAERDHGIVTTPRHDRLFWLIVYQSVTLEKKLNNEEMTINS